MTRDKENTVSITQKNDETDADFQKYRHFDNKFVKVFWNILLILIPVLGILFVFGVHQRLGISLYSQQYVGLFLGLMLSAIYLSVPASKNARKDKVPWYDWILAVLGFNAGLYVFIYYPKIVMAMGIVDTSRFVFSVVAVLLILEAIRRVLGKGLLTVVLVFLLYGYFAPYFPGVFKGTGTPINQLFSYMYLDSNSLLQMLNIAATIALSFIFFGQILLHFGGGEILNNFALSTFGRYRGGPAKGSIVGSSLVGTITGGPVANVILTGSVTIPLMKKNGHSAREAGAIESVASTGGSIMPPIMGVAAFLIAETLGIPYAEVALGALIPAVLYYVCLFFQVDFMAGRKDLGRLKKDEIPDLLKVLKKGWMIIPALGTLIYFLFFLGYSPQVSGIYASLAAIVFLSIEKSVRKQLLTLLLRVFIGTGKVMLEIGIVLSAAGLVVGITGITGLGFNLGLMLSGLAEFGLLPLLIVSAIVSIILGMGMPSIAAYALVAVLVAPTIIDLGVSPLAAHLFVYYFAIVSSFTPPIAMACFTAAPIAKADPNKIAFSASRLGIVGYLVPFLFVYAPELLLGSNTEVSLGQTILTVSTALIGCYLLSMALEGFLFQRLSIINRIIFTILSACLFIPYSVTQYSWIINGVAVVIAVIFVFKEWKKIKKEDAPPIINSVKEL
ncbi:TRAP transporter permease [Terrihalobacillus insolitus]|uniref:TRAP transporter permease n=1 Tax=Terrihalobacillus insolitus TaxID=2950438 RepID=UPI00233FA4EF|nr:TRAP transporter fused permease subunit [Terrihalobacillus insolitus]MDC3411903.1 TRAP transporter fused permease subunit [Terrihalobacillus insolitus]